VGRNFLAANRDQQYLMPPSLSDRLAEDHLAWFLLDVVDELDLSELYAAYRADGWGRAAHDPSMMLALLLYAYCLGERSSRRIQVRCREDVAFRVITANSFPDHATIARFRARHEHALTGLFVQRGREDSFEFATSGLGERSIAVGAVSSASTRFHTCLNAALASRPLATWP
jgi:transposase